MTITNIQIRQLFGLVLEYWSQLNFLDAKKDKQDEILSLLAQITEQSKNDI